jgi:prevent-host-death family protein
MGVSPASHVMSVSDVATRGVSGPVKDAEHGEDVIVARHGRPVAAVVSMARLEQLRSLESELRDVAWYSLGLETELAADLAAGRD